MINLFYLDNYPVSGDNGLNTYTFETLRGLKQFEEISTTCVWINSDRKQITEEHIERVRYIHFPTQDTRRTSPNDYFKSIVEIVKSRIVDSSNTIIHLNWIDQLPLAYILKQEIECKVVLTKHCIPWRDLVTSNYKSFYRLDIATRKGIWMPIADSLVRKEMMEYDSIDHIITVTKLAKRSLNTLFRVPNSKISTIYNGLCASSDRINRKKRRHALRKKYGFNLSEQIILFAGNVNARKGIFDLIACFESILSSNPEQPLRLIIAGPGDHSSIFENCKKLWSKITVTGSVSKAVLYDLYAMADLGVVPSYIEQCSYSAIEMMQASLPIIVSDVDGLREIVPENCGWKFKVKYPKNGKVSLDFKGLKEKIHYVLNNPTEARQKAKIAQAYSVREFSATRMVKQTVAVYREVSQRSQNITRFGVGFSEKTDTSPLISIILANPNASEFFSDCIQSVINQEHSNFELIILTSKNHRLSSEINCGVKYIDINDGRYSSIELNNAIDACSGKYTVILNSDSKLKNNALITLFQFLENNKDHVMVGGWSDIINANNVRLTMDTPFTDDRDLKLLMFFTNPFAIPVRMIRTEILKQIKYSTKYPYIEEYELNLNLSKWGKIANVPNNIGSFHVQPHSSKCDNLVDLKRNTIELIADRLDEYGIDYTLDELKTHGAIALGYGHHYFLERPYNQKLESWLEVFFSCPSIVKLFSKNRRSKLKDYVKDHLCRV